MIFVKVFLVVFFVVLVNGWYKSKKTKDDWDLREQIKDAVLVAMVLALLGQGLSFFADDMANWIIKAG